MNVRWDLVYRELASRLLRCVDCRVGWRSGESALGLDYVRVQDFSVAECMVTQRQMVHIIDNFLAEWLTAPPVAACEIASRFLWQVNCIDLAMADEGEIPGGLRADYLAVWLSAYLRSQAN